jgi:RNA polymerase primary sigma factor
MLKTYIKQISLIPLLTKEEEIEISRRVMSGDFHARDLLVRSNLTMVVDRAKKFRVATRRNICENGLEELIAEGNLGLMRAAETFNYEKFGTKFSTHAVPWIDQGFQKSFNRTGYTMQMKHHVRQKLRRFHYLERLMTQENHGRNPNFDEVVARMKLGKLKTRRLLDAIALESSTTESGQLNQDGWSLEDLVGRSPRVDVLLEKQEEFDLVMERMGRLTEVERKIVYAMTGMDGRQKVPTLRELEPELSITYQTVRNTYQRALKKLRGSA